MEQILIILGLAFAILLTLLSYVIASFGLSFLFGAPYVGTPKSIARTMLKAADVKKGETLVDLGSGSGTILLIAVLEFGAEKAIGYEINPFLVWITRFRARVAGIEDKVEIRRANFFKDPLPQVDVVALYLLNETLGKLRKPLAVSQAPETRIVSRGFVFDGVRKEEVRGNGKSVYLYRAKDL